MLKPPRNTPAESHHSALSPQLDIFRFGLPKNRDVWFSVLPQAEEVLERLSGFRRVAREREAGSRPMGKLSNASEDSDPAPCVHFESAKVVPRVHKAERLARGIKVVDTDPVSNPGSTQGGAEWRVTVYQPERKEPPPHLKAVDAAQAEEWEEA